MAAKENPVFSTARSMSSGASREDIPEAVILGYAKLLVMDESKIKLIIPEQYMADLEAARKVFDNCKLDLSLIRSGLLMFIAAIRADEEVSKKYKDYIDYLGGLGDNFDSAEVLTRALKMATVPMEKIFKVGRDISDVMMDLDDFKEKESAKIKAKSEAEAKEETDSKDNQSDTDKPGASEDKKEDEKDVDQNGQKNSESQENGHNADSRKKEQGLASQKAAQGLESPKNEGSFADSPKSAKTRTFLELSEKYRELNAALLEKIKGQDSAVLKFIQGYNQGELLKNTDRGNYPRTYFFFFGPPGVGKTYLAECAAEKLNIPFKIFNMTEYTGPQDYYDLVGVAKMFGSGGSDKEGALIQFVRKNPECLLVFDEIEKAHINTLRVFLQILGSGKLHSMYHDKDISFQDVTIIFTSNLGKELYDDRDVNLTTIPEKVLIDSVASAKDRYDEPVLPPELCSRIASGNVVIFNHLSIRHLAEMANDIFVKICEGMHEEYGCTVTYSRKLPLMFLYNTGGDIDGRVATGLSGRFFKNEIYELIRQIEKSKRNKVKSIHIDVDWDNMDLELKKLFFNEGCAEVLVMANKDTASMFETDDGRIKVHYATTTEEAVKCLENEITAVFIDPFFGRKSGNEHVLSIADYNTEGVSLFHKLTEMTSALPIYILEVGEEISEVDRKSFCIEGAAGHVRVMPEQPDSLRREVMQILEDIYMENENAIFTQRGWVIDYNTKQSDPDSKGRVNITFYDIRKRMAVDMDSRNSIISESERPDIGFDDIIGAKQAKDELKYFVEYLKNPRKFLSSGGKAPQGVLLYGPPGTGKTMLAKAMAGESDVAFIQTSASEFKNKYYGESEAAVRHLFATAKKYAPSIIFIDEIDAIGKSRSDSGNDQVSGSVLTELLKQMDGFAGADKRKPVFVLAATNYGISSSDPDAIAGLDEALARRFDNRIKVSLPNKDERRSYIDLLLDKKKIEGINEDIRQNLADRTTGESLAIITNVIELALRSAIKANRSVAGEDLLQALEDYMHGEKRENSVDYYRSVAIHESGHAYIYHLCGLTPSYITIESRADFGGYMQFENAEDVHNYSKKDLEGKIRSAMGGRAAEIVFYGKDKAMNTGASGDYRLASDLAFRILCECGMDDENMVVLSKQEIINSTVADKYIANANAIMKKELEEAVRLISEGREKVEAIAEELLKENHLTGEQFLEVMKKFK